MNIALFGGAFDPIHNGHLELANQVSKIFDQVWLVPCYGHTHGKNMTLAETRLSLCKDALYVLENDKIVLSDFEIVNKITTGTYDSLVLFSQNFSQHNFSVVIGQDNAETINTWENYEKLISEFSFVVFPRGDLLPHPSSWYLKEPHKFLDIMIPSYSSREVRKLIKERNFMEASTMLPNEKVLKKAVDLYMGR